VKGVKVDPTCVWLCPLLLAIGDAAARSERMGLGLPWDLIKRPSVADHLTSTLHLSALNPPIPKK